MRNRGFLFLVLLAAAPWLPACGRHDAVPPGPLDSASPAVAAAVAVQESLLAALPVAAPEAARMERYLHIMNGLDDPRRRDAVRREFFDAWSAEPADPLLIEISVMNAAQLGHKARKDSLLAVAAGPDTSAAIHRFVAGRLAWGHGPGAGRAFADARDRAEPGSLLAIWAGFRAASLEAENCHTDAAVHDFTATVAPAWNCGGPALAVLVWSDLSREARRAQHLDDALAAARMASACAAVQPDGYLRVRTRLSLAMAHKERGRIDRASALFEEAYEAARDSGYVRLRSVATGFMAIAAHATGDLDREIGALQHMEELTAAAGDTNGLLRAGLALADAMRRRGDTQAAGEHLDRMAWVNRAWSSGDMSSTFAQVRANLYNQEGHYAEAESLWSVAAAGGDVLGGLAAAITTQVNLVGQALETHRPALAYAALTRAREMRAVNPVAARLSFASLHLELAAARLYANQGEYELAAAAMDSASVEARHMDAQSAWFVHEAAGEVARLSGDPTTAARRFSLALAVADSLGVPDRVQRSRINLASVLLAEGRWQEADDLVQDELNVRSYWPRLHARLVRAMALARGGHAVEAQAAFAAADTALGDDAPADLAARLLLERGRNQLALGHPRTAYALVDSARSRLDGSAVLNTEMGRTFRRGIRRDVAELTLDLLRDHGAVLPVDDPVAVGRAVVAWVRHDQPAAAVGPRVEYFVGSRRSFAWATGGAGRPWRWTELAPSADLKALANAVATDMAYPDREVDRAAATRLGSMLYAPVLGDWPPEAELDIAPDRFLDGLPWAALPCATDGPPAIDRGPLVIVVGAPRPPSQDTGTGDLMVIGDNGSPGRGVASLVDAEAEARAIAQVWRGGAVDLRLGAQGRLDQLLDRGLRGFRAVHISTHADVYQGPEGETTVRLGGQQGVPLTLDRIAADRLDAQLVFLSNCEGARRYRNRGQGVDSLAEAFLEAGAGRVIASSLAVEDASARTLAESFYRRWLAGVGTAAALRAAVRELRDHDPDRAHPFYWGFIGLYERPTS